MEKYYTVKVLKGEATLKEFVICDRLGKTEPELEKDLCDKLNQYLTSVEKEEFWAALIETIQEFHEEMGFSDVPNLKDIVWEDIAKLGLIQNEEDYFDQEDIAVVLYNNFYTKSNNKENFYVIEFSRFDDSLSTWAITDNIDDAMLYWKEVRKKDFCKDAWIVGKTWGYF